MAVSATHADLPYPLRSCRFTVAVPLLDADGDPTAATTPDTEISKDGGAAADCTEEISAISGMDGTALMTFTGAEMDCATACVNFKSASGPKATLMFLNPKWLPVIGSGTMSAGSAGGGTLGTLLAYDVTGCFIATTGGTGGGGTGGANNQARRIATYNTGTGAFTVHPNWETTPSTDTTYEVLLPDGLTLGMLKALNPTTAGRTLDVSSGGEAGLDWANIGSPTTAVNLSATNIDVDQVVASVSGAVASVTATVNANMTQISGDSTAADNLETAFDDTAGPVPWFGIVDQGTAQSASSTGVVLRSAAAFADNTLIGMTIAVLGSTQGYWQSRLITDNALSGDTVTVATWDVTPSGTITYKIIGTAPGSGGGGGATAAEVADAVWDEAVSAHNTAGTFGETFNNLDTTADLVAALFTVDSGETFATSVAGSVVKEIADNANTGTLTESAIAAEVLATQLADAVPADGTRPTIGEALYMLTQFMFERSVSGTTVTVKKPDGSTTLLTLTLNDGTSPTSVTRTG